MRRERKPGSKTAAAAFAIALAVALSMPVAHAQEKKPDPDPMAFARGAKAWAQNCARCHEIRDPKELRDDQWKPVVTHMQIRAGLSGAQARDILRFLQASN